MVEKCNKCGLEVGPTKEGAKCSDCGLFFHVTCVSAESAKKLSLRKKWKCEVCSTETSSTGSGSSKGVGDREAGNNPVLEAITAFRQDIVTRLDNMQGDIKEVSMELSALKAQFEIVKSTSDQTCKSVEILKKENVRLGKELSSVQEELLELQQHTRKNNLLISGVPATAREDVYEVLMNVARVLDVQYYRQDISIAHRLSVRAGDTRPPSIVVSFVSRSAKEDWLAAARSKRGMSAKDLRQGLGDQRIFINEHLTPHTRALFNGARDLMKANALAAVWTSDCRVLARKTPLGRPFRIRDQRHLAELSQQSSPPITQEDAKRSPPSSQQLNTN